MICLILITNIILWLLLIYIGNPNKTRTIYIPVDGHCEVLIDSPQNSIDYIFQHNTYEYIPLDSYIHSLVDAFAISKNLPVNVTATKLFRSYFKIYKPTSQVLGPCLIFGSLDIFKNRDYQNHTTPMNALYTVLRCAEY